MTENSVSMRKDADLYMLVTISSVRSQQERRCTLLGRFIHFIFYFGI